MKVGNWTPEEDAQLRACPTVPRGQRSTVGETPLQALARELDRTYESCLARRRLIGAAEPLRSPEAEAKTKKRARQPQAHSQDKKIDRPKRPCACCGNRFQPTVRRRMLCARCFNGGGESAIAP